MYIYLFGISDLRMYDVIGALGLLIVVFFFLNRKWWPRELGAVAKEHIAAYADRTPLPLRGKEQYWLVLGAVVPMVVHLVFYMLGGERFANLALAGRATEFFGYIVTSAVGMALAAGALGYAPLRWLDRTAPLYLVMASVLKLCCFCAGCCNGLLWEHGLYNHKFHQTEFPIQLVELALYAGLLLPLARYKGAPGRRFSLFLTAYAAVRFVVQFFRVDRPLFSAFHWMSAVFFAVGVLAWVLCGVLSQKMQSKGAET